MYVKIIRHQTPGHVTATGVPTAAPYVALFECTSARWLRDPDSALHVLIEMEGSPCAAYHLAPEETGYILSDTGKTIDRVAIPD